jgi:Uma2 family endonuclease
MTAPQRTYTFADYEALEKADGVRYEFFDGLVVAMAGTTKRHNRLVQALGRVLYPISQRQGCQYVAENIKQKLRTGEKYVYPDLIYTCDPDDLADETDTIVRAPSLLIEVLSASTRSQDKHDKRLEYFRLPSLQAYLLVSQTDYRVEVYERAVDFWKYRVIEGLDAEITLPDLDIELLLADIYAG